MSGQTPSLSIDYLLEADPNIISVIPAEQLSLPTVNLEACPEQSRSRVVRGVDAINRAMKRPYIVDRFTDHEQRREWRRQIGETYGADARVYLETNALRINTINALLTGTSIILQAYGTQEDLRIQQAQDALRAAGHLVRASYDAMPALEKIEVVRGIKQLVCETLRLFEKEEQAALPSETYQPAVPVPIMDVIADVAVV